MAELVQDPQGLAPGIPSLLGLLSVAVRVAEVDEDRGFGEPVTELRDDAQRVLVAGDGGVEAA